MRRFVVLVADGLGVGHAPDAAKYGDEGANTLRHTAAFVGGLKLPNLQKLGLGNMGDFDGIAPTERPLAAVGRLAEKSAGKDTTTGHWELAGLVTHEALALFPGGFPQKLVDEFVREAGIPGVLGNKAASGTVIIDELGEEHLRTGKPILYTSGDSVFQIAADEATFGLQRLYDVCAIARRLTLPYQIGRVIARPFVGKDRATFRRTENRKDYSLTPGTTCLDLLAPKGVEICSVGKIDDIFAHRSISRKNHTGNNQDGLRATVDFLQKTKGERALIFANLVDFDMLYGHRRDPKGYAGALARLDESLPAIMKELTPEDCLIITADHGCDPTFRGTDHTREYVPLLAYQPGREGKNVGDRSSFTDVAATILEGYGIAPEGLPEIGSSFLCSSKS